MKDRVQRPLLVRSNDDVLIAVEREWRFKCLGTRGRTVRCCRNLTILHSHEHIIGGVKEASLELEIVRRSST